MNARWRMHQFLQAELQVFGIVRIHEHRRPMPDLAKAGNIAQDQRATRQASFQGG